MAVRWPSAAVRWSREARHRHIRLLPFSLSCLPFSRGHSLMIEQSKHATGPAVSLAPGFASAVATAPAAVLVYGDYVALSVVACERRCIQSAMRVAPRQRSRFRRRPCAPRLHPAIDDRAAH
jgi:hypothetical protein